MLYALCCIEKSQQVVLALPVYITSQFCKYNKYNNTFCIIHWRYQCKSMHGQNGAQKLTVLFSYASISYLRLSNLHSVHLVSNILVLLTTHGTRWPKTTGLLAKLIHTGFLRQGEAYGLPPREPPWCQRRLPYICSVNFWRILTSRHTGIHPGGTTV